MKLIVGGQEFEVQPSGNALSVGETEFAVRVVRRGNILTVYVNERPYAVQLPEAAAGGATDGPVKLLVDAKEYEVELKGRPGARPKQKAAAKATASAGAGAVLSQMTGRVIRVNVKTGDTVAEGDVLLVVEAMKMENEITAPMGGTVKEVAVAAGARVSEGDLLVQLEPAD